MVPMPLALARFLCQAGCCPRGGNTGLSTGRGPSVSGETDGTQVNPPDRVTSDGGQCDEGADADAGSGEAALRGDGPEGARETDTAGEELGQGAGREPASGCAAPARGSTRPAPACPSAGSPRGSSAGVGGASSEPRPWRPRSLPWGRSSQTLGLF